jgi:hypothetical protein
MLKIQDMRGSLYSANFIEIQGTKLFYAGFRVTDIVKQDRSKQAYFNSSDNYYYLFGGKDGIIEIGLIALNNEDAVKAINLLLSK